MRSPADIYEREMVPILFAPLAAHVVAAAQPQPGEQVLDVACGTGIVARRMAPLVGPTGQVTGLDLNAAMLAVARATAEQEGRRIAWHDGSAAALPFPDASFDLVVCQHGLQFMPDKPAVVAEMRRVLRPGGRVVVSVTQALERHPFDQQLSAAIEQRVGVAAIREIYALGAPGALRAVLEAGGLRHIAITPATINTRYPDPKRYLSMRITIITAAGVALQRLTPQERHDLVTDISAEMAPLLLEHTTDDHLVIPFHVQIARAGV